MRSFEMFAECYKHW